MKLSKPQPVVSCPQNATLGPGVHRYPSRSLVWLQTKARVTPSGVQLHTPPAGGVRVLEPPGMGPAAASCPLVPWCHRAGPLPLHSCLTPRGSSSHALPQPSAGQPVHGLQEGSPSRRLDWPPSSPASLVSACSAVLHSRAWAGGGAGAGQGSCRGCLQPASFPSRGQRLPQCHALQVRDSGSTAQGSGPILRPSAAASFELPTPLWSLYMLPEETVSTA